MTYVLCDYCQRPAERVTGVVIYPHRPDLADKRFFLCRPCGAYVGTHPDGKPLGRLANAELRAAKQHVHAAFDPLWKSGRLTRSNAYGKLADMLGIPMSECHIGMFDVDMCRQAWRAARELNEITL